MHKQTTAYWPLISSATFAQIIECAIDALAELGYGKTLLAQIAKRADISTSVVPYYFAGKDDLMREVIATTYGQAAQMMTAQIDPNAQASQILRLYIESNLAFGREYARELKALAESAQHSRRFESRPLPIRLFHQARTFWHCAYPCQNRSIQGLTM